MKFEFEESIGPGVDAWYIKVERWANKQNWFVKNYTLGFLAYLKKWWFNIKVENNMREVDRQAKEIVQQWEEEEQNQFKPEIKEVGTFGEDGWSISIGEKNDKNC